MLRFDRFQFNNRNFIRKVIYFCTININVFYPSLYIYYVDMLIISWMLRLVEFRNKCSVLIQKSLCELTRWYLLVSPTTYTVYIIPTVVFMFCAACVCVLFSAAGTVYFSNYKREDKPEWLAVKYILPYFLNSW